MSCLEATHTIVEIAFFIVTGTAAALGVHAWRRELRGRAEYDLARRVLLGAYRVRDRIRECQSPWTTPAEAKDWEPKPGESLERQEVSQSFHVYGNRFNRVLDALEVWETDVLEAEAVFGEEARRLCEGISGVAGELRSAIRMYHVSRWQGGDWTEADQQSRNIMHGTHASMAGEEPELRKKMDDGGYQERFVAAFKALDAHFRPVITQRATRFGRRRLPLVGKRSE